MELIARSGANILKQVIFVQAGQNILCSSRHEICANTDNMSYFNGITCSWHWQQRSATYDVQSLVMKAGDECGSDGVVFVRRGSWPNDSKQPATLV